VKQRARFKLGGYSLARKSRLEALAGWTWVVGPMPKQNRDIEPGGCLQLAADRAERRNHSHASSPARQPQSINESETTAWARGVRLPRSGEGQTRRGTSRRLPRVM
jgi:hypothetical protein